MTLPLQPGMQFGFITVMANTAMCRDNVAAAERHGFDSIWVGDHVEFPVPILDPLLQIAQAAGMNESLTFGTGVSGVDLDLRRPDGTLAGWTVIAGRNGTGKSALLRAIALALAGLLEARVLQDSFVRWVQEGEPRGEVDVTVVPDDGGTWVQRFNLEWQTLEEQPTREPILAQKLQIRDVSGTWRPVLLADQTPAVEGRLGIEIASHFIAGYGPAIVPEK